MQCLLNWMKTVDPVRLSFKRAFPFVNRTEESLEPAIGSLKQNNNIAAYFFFFFKFDILGRICQLQFNNDEAKKKQNKWALHFMSGVDLYKARQPIKTWEPTLVRPQVSGKRHSTVWDRRSHSKPNKWHWKEVKQKKNADLFEVAAAYGQQVREKQIQCGQWALGVTCEVCLGSKSPPPPLHSVDEKWQQTGAITRSSRTTPQ